MTTQYAVAPAETGLTLTAKLFTLADPDTVAYTADSVTERTNAKGQYVATFGETAAIDGDFTLILFDGSRPAAIAKRTFAGTDAEVATETKVAAELDPASVSAVQSGLATSAQVTALSASTVQVASPNVSGNLVLTQGDDYDGTANPKASWTVTTDYTDGWSVTLTIRDVYDAVIYTTAGTVVSATVVAVTIAAPTGLAMTGCPGQWQGKFDVQLTKAGKKKTIALGVCYINEDQTR